MRAVLEAIWGIEGSWRARGAVLEATWGIEGSWDRQLRRHGGQFWGHFEAWRAVAQAASKAIWAMEGSRRGSLGLWGQPAGAIGFKGSVGEGTSA